MRTGADTVCSHKVAVDKTAPARSPKERSHKNYYACIENYNEEGERKSCCRR